MTMKAITGARILGADGWRDGHSLLIDGARIAGIVADVPGDADVVRLDGGMLVPGFIDTQVNGGGGVLFNDAPTVEGIAAIGAAHRTFGTTGFLPTLISDDLSVIAHAIAAVDAAIAAGVPGVLGIHIEGPFLNTAKRGIHDASKFRRLDADAVTLLSSLTSGRTLVTLAPELAAAGDIAALVARGVIVVAGHSLATYDDMVRARGEGLCGVTHLFNAMTQLESRNPGIVGAVLDMGLYAGIIADGHHVHPAALRVALKAVGPERLMLVTDAMPTVGSADKSFRLGDVEIFAADGMLRSADGTLAGSDLDMAGGVRGAVDMIGVDLVTACAMASGTPAAFLGQAGVRGALAPGLAADIVHLDDDCQVRATWIGGARG